MLAPVADRRYPSRSQARLRERALATAGRQRNQCPVERWDAYQQCGVSIGMDWQLVRVKEDTATPPP